MADAVANTGGDGVSVDLTLLAAARDRVGSAIDALTKAKSSLEKARDAPQGGEFGRSDPALLVVRYWVEALGKRVDEMDKLVRETGGLYYAIQLCGDAYAETDENGKIDFNRISVDDVDRMYKEGSRPPGSIQIDQEDHAGSAAHQLDAREAGEGDGTGEGAAEAGAGADEED